MYSIKGKNTQNQKHKIVTAGDTYLDIDAYACMVAMCELLCLQGGSAVAFSKAPCNYSVCRSLVEEGQIVRSLPPGFDGDNAQYIVVDVSDPEFLKDSVPLDSVEEIYDHHVGFENYWNSRIDNGAHIEFIGAAATLVYRQWKKAELADKMSRSTALLLIAAILDNTLNLTSANTTYEDIEAYNELCEKENIDEVWCASYFSEVQASVESDLENAIFNDIKTVLNNDVLPPRVAQICVWNSSSIIAKLPEIRAFFAKNAGSWMINIIDIKQSNSYFVCDDIYYQKGIEKLFNIRFESGVAKTPRSYLRKEIIKKSYNK